MTPISRRRTATWLTICVLVFVALMAVMPMRHGQGRANVGTAMDAVIANDESALVATLNAGADPNAADHNGTTALHVAALLGYPRAASILLAHGASPDAADKLGETPLYLAARGGIGRAFDPTSEPGRNAVAALLLCNGAQVNPLATDGTIPLHHAADTGNVLLTRMLMAHGADPTVKAAGTWMGTPMDRAKPPAIARLMAPLSTNVKQPTTLPATTAPAQ